MAHIIVMIHIISILVGSNVLPLRSQIRHGLNCPLSYVPSSCQELNVYKDGQGYPRLVQTLATWLSSLNCSYFRNTVTLAYNVNKLSAFDLLSTCPMVQIQGCLKSDGFAYPILVRSICGSYILLICMSFLEEMRPHVYFTPLRVGGKPKSCFISN